MNERKFMTGHRVHVISGPAAGHAATVKGNWESGDGLVVVVLDTQVDGLVVGVDGSAREIESKIWSLLPEMLQ